VRLLALTRISHTIIVPVLRSLELYEILMQSWHQCHDKERKAVTRLPEIAGA
jgi:hypothetical protein